MRVFLLAFVLFLGCVCLHAQDNQLDTFTLEEVPQEEIKAPYFAVAGGFVGTFFFPKLDAVNQEVNKVLPGKKIDGPLFLTGGQGFSAIGIINNLRVGIIAMGGSKKVEGVPTTTGTTVQVPNLAGLKRQFEYSVSFTGLTVDYAFTPLKGLAILPGAMIGFGSITLQASQTVGDRSFDNEYNFDASSANINRVLSASHFTIVPNLNIEYAVTPFSMLRLNAGYDLTVSVSDWKADGDIASVKNVPSEIKMNGLSLQFGIFVGLFNN